MQLNRHAQLNRARPLSLAVLLAGAALAATARDAGAQNGLRVVTLTINVTPHKPNGAAWDAFGGAPDIAICTNSAIGQRCVAAGTGFLPSPSQFNRGRCQDAFSCAFVVAVPATGPVGLSIYDVDLSSHDLIGACAVERAGSYACGSATVVMR